MKKIVLLFFVLLNIVSYAQLNKPVFTQAQRDSITAMFHVLGDTILSGTATINVGADSVIVPHGLGSTPLISNINVSPQENYQGMSYWVQDITANTFKIKMDTTIAFDDVTEAISFSWQIFNADLSGITINALSDSIISGTATINISVEPEPDSIVITHNANQIPNIKDIQVTPQTDLAGFGWWIENITATTFEIQLGDTGYEAIAVNPKFSWWVIKRQ